MSGLAEFVGLVGRVGGPERVVLVGEGPSGSRARLQAFARDLFASEEEEEKEKEMEEEEEKKKNEKEEKEPRREVRVRLGGCGGGAPSSSSSSSSSSSWLSCSAGLVLVLFGAPSLLVSRERRRLLREILRDLRLRLASRQRPLLAALVAVAVLPEEDNEAEEEEEGEKARSQLEGLLRRTFGPGPGKRAQEEQEEGLVQAALYRPGRGAQGVREAACRALRAALRLRQNLQDADEVETKKQKFPLFLKCLPWGRRRQQRKGHLGTDANKVNEDTAQDQDEGLTLT